MGSNPTRRHLRAQLLAGLVASLAGALWATAAVADGHDDRPLGVAPNLVDCNTEGVGDRVDRGFYLEHYPGFTIETVTLWLSSTEAHDFSFTLTARAGAYDGPIIGAARTQVPLAANADPVPVLFVFGGVNVTRSSTVTFAMDREPGAGFVFYSTGDYPFAPGPIDPACPVTETDGTTPPLDTIRRQGIGVAITGFPGFVVHAPGVAADSGD